MVSILIRTIGRETLARSVASAHAQSHRPLEVVVVNAGTHPLAPMPSADDVPIHIVECPGFNRPRAANAALDNARGEWLVFLDDDDTFLPDHVESLLAAATQAGAGVAYSATLCVDDAGRGNIVMGAAFDRVHLFHGNYLQIGAALFRACLREGARFDETLLCLQDWDFWIQLARRTHFVYTGKPTNLWRAYTGSSGAGLGANQRGEETEPFRKQILRKWLGASAFLRGKVQYHHDAARSAAARGNIQAAERHMAAAMKVSRGPFDQEPLKSVAKASTSTGDASESGQ